VCVAHVLDAIGEKVARENEDAGGVDKELDPIADDADIAKGREGKL